MLLILIAVHLLSKDSSAVTLPYPLDTRTTADSCDAINNCRTLFSIVWGCLVTVFTCTWVSVHPNVPPPDQSPPQLFWRRLKMMLIGIIAPELMVGFAARQRLGAHMLSKEFKFSETHGIFFCMGGFISSAGYPVATKKQLQDPALGWEFQEAIQNVNKEDIMDKSKGDALSKGVALLQGLWFILQCIARVHQHLAVTPLEVATLAFAVLNVFIWLLWWDKPLNVQRPIVVGPRMPPAAQDITLSVQLSRPERIWGAIIGHAEDEYKPLSSVSVPSFWSMENDDEVDVGALIFLTLLGMGFGAIHCTAWNAVFPTRVEMWIWRTSSSVITAMPCLALLLTLMLMAGKLFFLILTAASLATLMMGSPFYIAARVILIVLPLICLRSLPPSAFVDVNWIQPMDHR
ncbi:hypothetical protein MSAN_00634800 [Mycena sanguinolenta]|uniref:Uncharacterized protein n=1 Tax=Mycena sanguinolenta TaxID=230812 RepID=A0A8H7DF89_9AGAR|nr:hypothetical protein MSAN_00634800 [Mycena sanguinolenta]